MSIIKDKKMASLNRSEDVALSKEKQENALTSIVTQAPEPFLRVN